MKKFLITDYVHSSLSHRLESLGFQVDYDKDILRDELKPIIKDYSGIVINSKTIMDREMIDLAPHLEFIVRLGSGLEIIDLIYAKSKGIRVINTPEGNRNAVAEHAMGMLLAFANNLIRSDRQVKDMIWERELNRGFELEGKVIGIVGFGNTGRSFASKLKNWNVDIIAHDKYVSDFPAEYEYVQSVSKEEIMERAEIISFHLPLTEETHHYVDKGYLSRCKDDVVIINTSRGKVIHTPSLLDALQSNKVMGACLDVFENEKPHTYSEAEKSIYKALFELENVIVSPHVAGWTHESLKKIADTILMKLNLSK